MPILKSKSFLVLFFKKELLPFFACVSICAVVAGCDLAPKYHSPVVASPASYAEAAHWQKATPLDTAPRGDWWRVYDDAALNKLEAKVDVANPDIAAATAIYDQARAMVAEARAGLYPQLSLGGHISTNRQSARRPLRSEHQPNQYLDNAVDTEASYEFDIWDRIANAVKAGRGGVAANQANPATLQLSLHAELASDYFTLRGFDAEAALYVNTVQAYRQALSLTQNRFAGKIASGMDVSRAAAQLADAEAQATDITARRALAAHAIAVLVGLPPSALPIPPAVIDTKVPPTGAGMPATLLQRRPDIAAAERSVAAANAEIGVVRAAFYPNISLNLILGFQDTGFNMFNLPDSFWSVGPGVTLPLFEGGLRTAEENAAAAVYRRTVAEYRSTVLDAFRDVEDQLALLHWLGDERAQEDEAVRQAGKTLTISLALYKDGATNFLDVVTAQTAELQAERAALEIRTRQIEASVGLIRALGGGWSART
jgi:NodT family efflux transporter outer membrane factor (OMF) lipoprotein